MYKRFKIIMTCMGLSIFLSLAPINAQILQDTTALNLVREDIDYIYNMQFNNAREVYTKIIKLYPGHPIVFLLKGILTYWENYPMLRTTPPHVTFEEDMRQCIKLSETNINPDFKAEYLLADLCASGMLLKGILKEKKYHDNILAQQYYNQGISDISLFGKYGNEFAAYAYFGLSRISESNDDKQVNNIYRKEAMKLATFKKINFDN